MWPDGEVPSKISFSWPQSPRRGVVPLAVEPSQSRIGWFPVSGVPWTISADPERPLLHLGLDVIHHLIMASWHKFFIECCLMGKGDAMVGLQKFAQNWVLNLLQWDVCGHQCLAQISANLVRCIRPFRHGICVILGDSLRPFGLLSLHVLKQGLGGRPLLQLPVLLVLVALYILPE